MPCPCQCLECKKVFSMKRGTKAECPKCHEILNLSVNKGV